MILAVGDLAVSGTGMALVLAGQMWWGLGVLLVGLLGMNAFSRR